MNKIYIIIHRIFKVKKKKKKKKVLTSRKNEYAIQKALSPSSLYLIML